MDKVLPVARSELILGGQKSGKSRRAEVLAQSWLAQSGSHRAVMIATGQAWDDEMTQRIARHQADRAQRVPGMITVEEPLHLAQAIQRHSTPDTLIVVDCLTLWLTNWLMPMHANATDSEQTLSIETGQLLQSISSAPGPLVLVGNEIGLGVIPLGREVRVFVDALGLLNQQVAAACARVTLMAAGLPLTLKDVS
ncbi:MAG: bifunctional adenosylcobinamide kinase/adenosylcobinamide-phosphate guanylyltransferase [Rhodoferax sp.]|uniref:bifunctional adenosylcobinamide kinase/adenosylcobinamide-phosphate guanylyltransferase n=1 Tax=Rhodoferax sp. TaxID=50421 RepID=UPI002731E890|nr:bifunctional adenosylcobinamide kinase/adenosylcobinamide-phosphate guanylyltransferase [Rhodoferax sp.]MDP1531485.1 bifunctional adenosylcobinamide kinase/adenosylcobinamide-phosphate guanylyltransferase [Rhodoferax sp.]MDP1945281.1 bifunctional adenosylcobinamide kinase/adenosylcobinamide-phosphate guanylyltransferase [Rhodoferax sp.]